MLLDIGLGSQAWYEILIRLAVIIAVAAVVLVVLRRAVGTAIRAGLVADPVELERRVSTLSDVVFKTVVVITVIIAGLTILSNAGFDVTPVLAGAGVVGLAVGLGAQSLIRDGLNGVFILLENQYARGDVVTIAGVNGLVEDVNLRRTLVRDQEGTQHSIPNSQVAVASNHTRRWARMHVNVSVGLQEDVSRVIAIIDRVGRELSNDERLRALVISAPRATWVDAIGLGSMQIKVLGDTRPGAQWEVAGEFRRRLVEACRKEGVQLV